MTQSDRGEMWRKRIAALGDSGLTVQEWCRRHGSTPRQFAYWRAKLRREEKPDAMPGRWVAISVADSAPVAPGGLTIRIAGAEIDVLPGFDASLLRAVVCALGEQAC